MNVFGPLEINLYLYRLLYNYYGLLLQYAHLHLLAMVCFFLMNVELFNA